LTSTQTYDQTPDSEISVDVVSTVIRVRELDRSLKFYCDVFSCRVVVREADMALLLTPQGFEIYLHQNVEFHSRAAGALGIHHLMLATDSQSDLQRITDRLRAYDSAVYSHTFEGMTILEGTDPSHRIHCSDENTVGPTVARRVVTRRPAGRGQRLWSGVAVGFGPFRRGPCRRKPTSRGSGSGRSCEETAKGLARIVLHRGGDKSNR
jgi:catechol 2,3-dioxygenase-like lactoylglutathione lyase family enzyme